MKTHSPLTPCAHICWYLHAYTYSYVLRWYRYIGVYLYGHIYRYVHRLYFVCTFLLISTCHPAMHCNTLQHTLHMFVDIYMYSCIDIFWVCIDIFWVYTEIYICIYIWAYIFADIHLTLCAHLCWYLNATLQHAATRCSTLQHAATHCGTRCTSVLISTCMHILICPDLIYTHTICVDIHTHTIILDTHTYEGPMTSFHSIWIINIYIHTHV